MNYSNDIDNYNDYNYHNK